MNRTLPISGELLLIKEEVEKHARQFGLDFPNVVFEVCDYDTINILAAQGGFPARYPHWRFGMDYDQLSKGHTYGIQKIYEMVVNTDPCYAYLHKSNNFVDQKIVMAHVYGHADFFKNNCWFLNTNKNMMDVMANHGTKIRRYIALYGQDVVESFIDKILSLENLIDINMLFETREVQRSRHQLNELAEKEMKMDGDDGLGQALRTFMRSKEREEEKKKGKKKNENEKEKEKEREKEKKESLSLSPSPQDVMGFLLENAPLKEWEADILGILRDETYYFLPQKITKIINEGWASYWHSKIMTQKVVKVSEIIDYSDRHSSVTAMARRQINPYKIGIELFRDIEFRWDTGRFGRDYQECLDMSEKANWNKNLGLGEAKIFEVRKSHNDITFIDEFLTPEFCERHQLFTYKYNPRTGRHEIDNREFEGIKGRLLSQLTNFGSPVIEVEEGNFNNRGELLLKHVHQGVDLDLIFAEGTMKPLHAIWSRPVNLRTQRDGNDVIYSFDGKEMRPL